MKDYIVLEFGKVFIVFENGVKNYYKEVNGDLVELNNEELLKVIDLFNRNDGV